jgi:hypothetical protein
MIATVSFFSVRWISYGFVSSDLHPFFAQHKNPENSILSMLADLRIVHTSPRNG